MSKIFYMFFFYLFVINTYSAPPVMYSNISRYSLINDLLNSHLDEIFTPLQVHVDLRLMSEFHFKEVCYKVVFEHQ